MWQLLLLPAVAALLGYSNCLWHADRGAAPGRTKALRQNKASVSSWFHAAELGVQWRHAVAAATVRARVRHRHMPLRAWPMGAPPRFLGKATCTCRPFQGKKNFTRVVTRKEHMCRSTLAAFSIRCSTRALIMLTRSSSNQSGLIIGHIIKSWTFPAFFCLYFARVSTSRIHLRSSSTLFSKRFQSPQN